MDETSKKPTIGFWAAVGAAVLVHYVGGYLSLVSPEQGFSFTPSNVAIFAEYKWPGSEKYIDSDFVRAFFSPLNALDRKVRPKKWTHDD